MAKEKLIHKPPDDQGSPREQFQRLAGKVFSVPKSEIDRREKDWRERRNKAKASR